MKKGTIILLVILGVIVIGAFSAYSWYKNTYNNFITLEQKIEGDWAQVENQFQRRADLVPNLVNTVKGVADFEKETYTAVTEARSKVSQINVSPEMLDNPAAFQQFQNAQNELGNALSRLLVTVENYPQLKANENFLSLQAQLEGTENRISVARRSFNESVRSYNTAIKLFPASIVANLSGFSDKEYFQADEGAETVPNVEF